MMDAAATAPDTRPHTAAAPTLPGEFRELESIPRPGQYSLIAARLDTVRKAYLKHTRWHEACAVYSAGAGDPPNVRTMPSKAAKHRMYGDAASLARACGWDTAATRCQSLDDIACLIATVESLLRGR